MGLRHRVRSSCGRPSPRFTQVIATDISLALLERAPRRSNIVYQNAPAENSGIGENSVDLITVAQAAHWFDLSRFWVEAQRVLRRPGILAIWGYNWPLVCPEVDAVLEDLKTVLASYWPERIGVLQ